MNQMTQITKCVHDPEWINFPFLLVDFMASFSRTSRSLTLGILVIFYLIHCLHAQQPQQAQKPHIIMIVADDLVSILFFFLNKVTLEIEPSTYALCKRKTFNWFLFISNAFEELFNLFSISQVIFKLFS